MQLSGFDLVTNLQVFACLLAVQRRGSYTHVHNHNMNMNYARVCVSEKITFQGSEVFPPPKTV